MRALETSEYTSRDQARYGCCKYLSRDQDRTPFGQLFARVPRTQHEEGTREKWGLDDAEEETNADQTCVASHASRGRRNA